MTRKLTDKQIETMVLVARSDYRNWVYSFSDIHRGSVAEAALWQAEIAAEQDCCTQQAVEAVGYKAEIDKLKEREKRLVDFLQELRQTPHVMPGLVAVTIEFLDAFLQYFQEASDV